RAHRQRVGRERPAVELDAHVLLLLAVEHERRAAIGAGGCRIAAERERRRDLGSSRIEIQFERDVVHPERRRKIVDAALRGRAHAARAHHRRHRPCVYFTSSSSTSKISVAFGGITPPAPRSPYAICGGITSVRCPPTFMPATPSSQPLITRPAPSVNPNGVLRSRELSNFAPCESGLDVS